MHFHLSCQNLLDFQRLYHDENDEDLPSPKRRRKSDKEDYQIAIIDGLRHIVEFLGKMEEEARVVRRVFVEILETVNPVVSKK